MLWYTCINVDYGDFSLIELRISMSCKPSPSKLTVYSSVVRRLSAMTIDSCHV